MPIARWKRSALEKYGADTLPLLGAVLCVDCWREADDEIPACWVHVTPEQIRTWRRRKGISQIAAAELAGVSPNSISAWESGERVARLAAQRRLSELVGVSRGMPKSRWTHVTLEQIEEWRAREGVATGAVCQLVGLSRSNYSHWLAGRNVPSKKTQKELAKLIAGPSPASGSPAPAGRVGQDWHETVKRAEEWRRAHQIPQIEVSRLLGVSRNTYPRWVTHGAVPATEKREALKRLIAGDPPPDAKISPRRQRRNVSGETPRKASSSSMTSAPAIEGRADGQQEAQPLADDGARAEPVDPAPAPEPSDPVSGLLGCLARFVRRTARTLEAAGREWRRPAS